MSEAEKCGLCGQMKRVDIELQLTRGGYVPICRECHDRIAELDWEWNGELKDLESIRTKE